MSKSVISWWKTAAVLTVFCGKFIDLAMVNKADCRLISSRGSWLVSFVLYICLVISIVCFNLHMNIHSNGFLIWWNVGLWLFCWSVFAANKFTLNNFAVLSTQKFIRIYFLMDPIMSKTKLFFELLVLWALFKFWRLQLLTFWHSTLSLRSFGNIFHMCVYFRLVKQTFELSYGSFSCRWFAREQRIDLKTFNLGHIYLQ